MKTSKKLIKIQQKFDKFKGKPLDKNRKELYKLIVEVVQSGDFIRKDEGRLVNLWYKVSQGMTPDLVISVDKKRNIWICDDSLWRTIEGFHEWELEVEMNRD